MNARRYTAAEIDRMRQAIIEHETLVGSSVADCELFLRTYMLNGSSPDEVCEFHAAREEEARRP